jgi:hypothetical protein
MPAAVVDLPGLVADAEERLEVLRPRVQELSLDALSDPAAARELADVRAGIASAEGVLEQAALAGAEQARRAELERQRQAAEARAAALARAAQLDVELQAAGSHVDEAFEASCRCVLVWLKLAEERDGELAAARRSPGVNAHAIRAFMLAGAYAYGMRGLPLGLLKIEGAVRPRDVAPLVNVNDVNDEKGH